MKKEEFFNLICDVLNIQRGRITEESSMANTENWDSLALINIIALIDEQFDLSLTNEEINRIRSIKEIVKILKDKGVLE